LLIAKECFRGAAEGGNPCSAVLLGEILLEEKEYDLGIEWLERAIRDLETNFRTLTELVETSHRLSDEDDADGNKLITMAHNLIGSLFFEEGPPQNVPIVLPHLLAAAHEGMLHSQFACAVIYLSRSSFQHCDAMQLLGLSPSDVLQFLSTAADGGIAEVRTLL
jgi:hypothetical protein